MRRARVFRRRKAIRCVDWNRILIDLGIAGFTLCEISALIRVPRSTLIGWKNGNHEPRYSSGVSLLNLWIEKVEKQTANVKTMRPIPQEEFDYGPNRQCSGTR